MSKLSEAKHHIEVKVDMDELDLTSDEAFSDDMREKNDWLKPNGSGQSIFLP